MPMAEKPIESLKLKFIQEVMAENSYDALQEWLDMHEEARYAASTFSEEPELIEFGKNYEASIIEGFTKARKKMDTSIT
jgi:hypothetical protein